MPLHHQTHRSNGIVAYEVHGEGSLGNLHHLIDVVARDTLGSTDTRVMLNLLAVAEQMNFTDRFSLGEQVARRLAHLERLAAVVPAERYTGTGEKVATAHGVRLRVFATVAQAVAWLTDRDASAAAAP
jgi:hypothetical protein